MQIQILFTPHEFDELALREQTAVVIDVLRSSTTVITALQNGAREVIPTPNVESAAKIAGHLNADVTVRGGERNGKMIEGFALGNSPLEYTEDRVRDKSIVYNTTNGSPLILRAKYAKYVVVCGFVNISAVAGFLRERGGEVKILCAGNSGRFAIEDAVCAGMLVHLLGEEENGELALCDAALAAKALYRASNRNILRMVRQSEEGRYLDSLGFGDDLRYCAGLDTIPVLPLLDDNVLRLRRESDLREGPVVQASV
jgi:2-phosphosulfolactate phosphatase